MTDDDFKQAAKGEETPLKQAAQNPAQYAVETVGNEVKPEGANPGFTGFYGGLPTGTLISVGDKGFEPLTPSV